jgi:hypothetical protein
LPISESGSSACEDTSFWFEYHCVLAIVVALFLLTGVCLALHPLVTLERVCRFSRVDPANPLVTYSNLIAPSNGRQHDVLIVYTTCNSSDRFAIWKTAIPAVRIECDSATRANDCNEAVPLLNFVIRHYDEPLAARYVFAHGHNYGWHYQGDFFDGLRALFRTRYWRRREYGGVFKGFYAGGAWGTDEGWWARPLYSFVFSNTSMPMLPIETNNFRPCCATFWFNSALIRTRKKDEYITIRERLREWSRTHQNLNPTPAFYCGRIMEYNWHILLANRSCIPRCHFCQGYYI